MTPSPSDFALQEQDILQALTKAKSRDVDYADMYLESSVTDSVSMEESLVKRAVKNVAQGAGIRAVAGERTGFAYSDDLSVQDLVQAAETARVTSGREAFSCDTSVRAFPEFVSPYGTIDGHHY